MMMQASHLSGFGVWPKSMSLLMSLIKSLQAMTSTARSAGSRWAKNSPRFFLFLIPYSNTSHLFAFCSLFITNYNIDWAADFVRFMNGNSTKNRIVKYITSIPQTDIMQCVKLSCSLKPLLLMTCLFAIILSDITIVTRRWHARASQTDLNQWKIIYPPLL